MLSRYRFVLLHNSSETLLKKIFILASVFLQIADMPALHAHQLNSSYSTLEIAHHQIKLTLMFDISDLERVFPLDENRDGAVDREEAQKGMPEMYAYFAEHYSVALGYTPVEMEPQEGNFYLDEFGNMFINFIFTKNVSAAPEEIGYRIDFFEKFGQAHKNLAKAVAGDTLQTAILTADQPRHRFVLGEEVSLLARFREFIVLGIEHIFLGYDHIMFLLGLIAIGGRFIDLIKIVTSFTIAHSITLILAALEVVALPGRLIESGIALSIAYVAAENFIIFTGNNSAEAENLTRHRWVLTFFFGLVHGFGFANVLRDLGLPGRGLIGSLLSFNIGVELGQIAIVGVLFPIILSLAKTKFQRQVVYAVSSIIFVFGLSWFIERSFALSFMPF